MPEVTPPAVSVVVPAYNAEAFVGDAVGSALAQGPVVGEVVLVDDGSTDGTLGVMHRLAEAANVGRPGLVRVVSQPNGGAPSARNRGLAQSTCDYVQFLDADDVLLPGKVERHVAAARRAGAGLVAGAYDLAAFGSADRPSRCRVIPESAWLALIRGMLGLTSANLWRRHDVEAVGGWDEALANNQEYDLAFRMMASGVRVAFDTEAGALVRRRPGSIWTADAAASNRGWIDLRVRVIDHLRSVGEYGRDLAAETDRPLFKALQAESARDPAFARRIHDGYVSDSFDVGRARVGPVYRWVYGRLGFRAAEAYRRLRQPRRPEGGMGA